MGLDAAINRCAQLAVAEPNQLESIGKDSRKQHNQAYLTSSSHPDQIDQLDQSDHYMS